MTGLLQEPGEALHLGEEFHQEDDESSGWGERLPRPQVQDPGHPRESGGAEGRAP